MSWHTIGNVYLASVPQLCWLLPLLDHLFWHRSPTTREDDA